MQKGSALIFIVLGILLLIILVGGGVWGYNQNFQNIRQIKSFDDCAKYYPVMKSYPAQCNTPDGQHFTQQLTPEEQKKLEDQFNQVKERSNLPNTDETVSWEVYKDITKGFEFKYPSYWRVEENDDKVSLTIEIPHATGSGDHPSNIAWVYIIRINAFNYSKIEKKIGVQKTEQITINGKLVTRETGFSGIADSVYFRDVTIPAGEDVIIFSLSLQDQKIKDALISEFDKVLTTVNILNI